MQALEMAAQFADPFWLHLGWRSGCWMGWFG